MRGCGRPATLPYVRVQILAFWERPKHRQEPGCADAAGSPGASLFLAAEWREVGLLQWARLSQCFLPAQLGGLAHFGSPRLRARAAGRSLGPPWRLCIKMANQEHWIGQRHRCVDVGSIPLQLSTHSFKKEKKTYCSSDSIPTDLRSIHMGHLTLGSGSVLWVLCTPSPAPIPLRTWEPPMLVGPWPIGCRDEILLQMIRPELQLPLSASFTRLKNV